ncbi:hypothetical protein C7974DRAFT_380822 [Boeremia exigua]|uniref:uncharacterized protein n=1 Tax=Boeremia exigua TaxID=749465 RepID=UPI001E8E1353|nr:uncharacterized protein C7974DRAFT_380822 [Boeremia exigua]KAH6613111.1 hypothetical protein C7974DRAFT_380822 [Boeremia exigua]
MAEFAIPTISLERIEQRNDPPHTIHLLNTRASILPVPVVDIVVPQWLLVSIKELANYAAQCWYTMVLLFWAMKFEAVTAVSVLPKDVTVFLMFHVYFALTVLMKMYLAPRRPFHRKIVLVAPANADLYDLTRFLALKCLQEYGLHMIVNLIAGLALTGGHILGGEWKTAAAYETPLAISFMNGHIAVICVALSCITVLAAVKVALPAFRQTSIHDADGIDRSDTQDWRARSQHVQVYPFASASTSSRLQATRQHQSDEIEMLTKEMEYLQIPGRQ